MSLNNDPLEFLNLALVDVEMRNARTWSMPTICRDSKGYHVAVHELTYDGDSGLISLTRQKNINPKPLAYAGAAWVLEQELRKPKWATTNQPARITQDEAEALLKKFALALVGEPHVKH